MKHDFAFRFAPALSCSSLTIPNKGNLCKCATAGPILAPQTTPLYPPFCLTTSASFCATPGTDAEAFVVVLQLGKVRPPVCIGRPAIGIILPRTEMEQTQEFGNKQPEIAEKTAPNREKILIFPQTLQPH